MAGSAAMPFAMVAFAWSRQLPTSLPFLLVLGFGTVVITAITATMLLILVPDEVRGRVNSLGTMVYFGTPYVAGLAVGFIAEQAGAPITLTLSASLFLVSLIVINLKSPAVRRLA
jgi:MFS family permease